MHAGTVGVGPSFVQRSLLILLERMGPYLAERISSAARAPLESDSTAAHTLQDPLAADPVQPNRPIVGITDAFAEASPGER